MKIDFLRHGAEVLEDTNTKKRSATSFVGTGYRLGETDNDSVVIPGQSGPTQRRQVGFIQSVTVFSYLQLG